jgi:hypothetical protein
MNTVGTGGHKDYSMFGTPAGIPGGPMGLDFAGRIILTLTGLKDFVWTIHTQLFL